jgi:hypothetical protein
MEHKKENYSHKSPECSNGDTFVSCNISQIEPATEICSGKTNLTFRNCNLFNCRVPEDAIVVNCNTAQVKIRQEKEELDFDGEEIDIVKETREYLGKGVHPSIPRREIHRG